jgi:broad specificity phosphatase PhoE
MIPMMLLIRHAMVDACGRVLAGRTPGVHLNDEGKRQAAALGEALRSVPISAIYSSPLERAQETAAAIAHDGHATCITEDLNEVDFGDWTGMPFATLDQRRDWLLFNRARSTSPIPGGERMRDVQLRACRALTRIARAHPDETVALISHGDVLRALVAHVLDAPLDRIDAFAIDPASVSVIVPTDRGFELTRLNCHAYSRHCCATDD